MKNNIKIKIVVLVSLLFLMIGYIIFMCYESEPKYENNIYRVPQVGDYVDVFLAGGYSADDNTYNGFVVRTDSNSFSVNFKTSFEDYRKSGIISFPKKFEPLVGNYKILGRGTFYHKANLYVGFNIMMITIWINIVLAIVILITLGTIIRTLIY